MWRKANGQVQVAIGTTADSRSALALEANAFTIGHPGRDLHVQAFAGVAHMLAGSVVLRHLEGDLLRLGRQGFFEKNAQFHLHVLPSASGAAT
ncbi:hypothetical protein D3C78_1785640 [compost metagenome]